MLQRAYSLLNVKAVSETADEWVITGIASTPKADRLEDVVEPMGARFALPMPLLWQHMADKPVGRVEFAKPSKNGIPYVAHLPKVKEAGVLKDRIDEAVQSIKYRLVAAVSIGFRAVRGTIEAIQNGGSRYKEWEWMELSLVTIPANTDATITSIKSLDQSMRAASGAQPGSVVRLDPSPGVSGQATGPTSSRLFSAPKGNTVKNIQEQIAEFTAKRAQSVGRMTEIMSKSADEGCTLDESQREEYDGLQADVKEIDGHIVRLKQHEATIVATATVVTEKAGMKGIHTPAEARNSVISVRSNLPPGIRFTRLALATVRAKGNLMQAEMMTREFTDTPEVNTCMKAAMMLGGTQHLVQKAAVNAGTTQDAGFASALVQYNDMASEFIELLHPMTILGKLKLNHVPFNIRIPRETGGVTGAFVGEGAPKPVNEMTFDSITMQWFKAAVIVILTDELVRFSNPSAEMLARNSMLKGISKYLDMRFIDPGYAGVANVSPASITNGVTATNSSGSTIAAITADVKAMMTGYANAELTLTSGAWIMAPKTSLALSMIRNTNDEFAFPGVTMNGGTFFGLPVVTSNSVALAQSPSDSYIVLLDQDEILLADDGGISIDMSMEASVQMNDAPSAGAQSLVSLWQNNMVGLRAERYINWRARRDNAVAILTNVNY